MQNNSIDNKTLHEYIFDSYNFLNHVCTKWITGIEDYEPETILELLLEFQESNHSFMKAIDYPDSSKERREGKKE